MSPIFEYRCQHGNVIERNLPMGEAPQYATAHCKTAHTAYYGGRPSPTRDVVTCTYERIMSVNAKPRVHW